MIFNLDTSNLLLTSKSIPKRLSQKGVAAVPREASSIVVIIIIVVVVVIVIVVVVILIVVVVVVVPKSRLGGLWVILMVHVECASHCSESIGCRV